MGLKNKNEIKISINPARLIPSLTCCIFEITLACNLQCIHCGSYAGRIRGDELTKEEFFKLIDDLKTLKCQYITVMGGELILRRDWFEICEHIKKSGIELIIITNGYSLNEDVLEKIDKLSPYTVALSLDGLEKVHDKIRGRVGSFEKVVESIKNLDKMGISIGLITTLSKLNIGELSKMKEFIYSLGINIRWQIQTAVHGHKLTKDLLVDKHDFIKVCKFIDDSQKEKKYNPVKLTILGADDIGYNQSCLSPFISADHDWHGCKAGINVLGIQSNGNVKGCLSLPDDFIEGNVKDRSIIEIWNDSNSFNFTRNFSESDLGENCKGCKFGKKCRGGCSDVSFCRTGKTANNPLCLYKLEKQMEIK